MRNPIPTIVLLLACGTIAAMAQVPQPVMLQNSAPSGACDYPNQIRMVSPGGQLWTCQNLTWAQIGALPALTPGYGVTANSGGSVVSTPNVFYVDQYAGADLCAKLATALGVAHTLYGNWRGIFDARGFSSGQSCGVNPFAALPSSGEAGILVLLPSQGITVNAGIATSMSDVVLRGVGQGGASGLFAGASLPANTPLVTFGTGTSLNDGERLENLRVDANSTNSTYTLLSFINGQEFSGMQGVNVVGSASATADAVTCVNCLNMMFLDNAISKIGANNAITFSYNSGFTGNPQESNLLARNTFNNTGSTNGTSCINFATTSAMSWSTVLQAHCEGFATGLNVAADNYVNVDGFDTTGSVLTTLINGASGAMVSVRGLLDGGSVAGTVMVNDSNYSPALQLLHSTYAYGGHALLSMYDTGPQFINAVTAGTPFIVQSQINPGDQSKITIGDNTGQAVVNTIPTNVTAGRGASYQFCNGYTDTGGCSFSFFNNATNELSWNGLNGRFTNVGGMGTTGLGVPATPGFVTCTQANCASTSTNLVASALNTIYQVSATSSCTSTVASATVIITVTYTDPGSQSVTLTNATSTCTATTTYDAGTTWTILAKSGTAIAYSVATANAPQYNARVTVTALGPN